MPLEGRFVPFVLEATGTFGAAAALVTRNLARLATPTRTTKDPLYSLTLRHYVQQVSFSLQLGNARAINTFAIGLAPRLQPVATAAEDAPA